MAEIRFAPCLRHRETLVEPAGDGAWRVRVVVENTGWLPTQVTQMALGRRAVLPLRAGITLPDGAALRSRPTRRSRPRDQLDRHVRLGQRRLV